MIEAILISLLYFIGLIGMMYLFIRLFLQDKQEESEEHHCMCQFDYPNNICPYCNKECHHEGTRKEKEIEIIK